MHAGSADNVIADRATLGGTLRAGDTATRKLLGDEVQRIADGIAAAHGVSATVALRQGPPPIVNPAGATAWARQAAEAILGADAIVPLGTTNMARDDFACYMEGVPGCFIESIFVGAAVRAEAARVSSAALLRERR